MKRAISILMIFLMVSMTYAETPADVIITLDGEIMTLEEPVFIRNGRTLVPVRYLLEPLGLEVNWDHERFVATGEKEGLYIEMPIGSRYATVNGETFILDSAAEIINSRTYVPLRFVAESTGATVLWDGETNSIAITSGTGPNEKNYADYLIDIYEDVNDYNGPNYLAIRKNYHQIYDDLMLLKADYIEKETSLKYELMKLANTKDIKLSAEDDLIEMMSQVNEVLLPIHENETDKVQLVSEDGYYNLHYDTSYFYGYFQDYEATGYRYGYSQFDEGFVLSLSPYEANQRNGIGYKLVYNLDGSLRYQAYFKLEADAFVDLEYTKYEAGVEAFDRGDIENDVVLRIEPDGTIFIPPTDESQKSDLFNTGVGFTRLNTGVEYVGYYDEWDRLGEGLYFAPDDDFDLESNLVELRSEEILENILTETMNNEQKIKNIHDYLVNHIVYDKNEVEGNYVPMSHTAYGALINGVAVCDGYAEAFKFLLDKSEIENVLIFGEGQEEGNFTETINHAWNLVKIGDDYVHFDLTWNDDDVNQRAVYTYYNKNTDYMDDTHWWVKDRYSMYLD